jgi:hypothetical protein
MIQVYGFGLNQPAKASQAAELVAEADPTSQTFLTFSQYAALAGQKRKADLAAEKALELAPKGERDTVKAFIEQAKAAPPAEGQGGAGQQPAPGGG